MKITVLLWALIFFSSGLSAQFFVNSSGVFEKPSDITGRPFIQNKNEAEGNQMLMEDWGNGIVKTKNGKVYKDVILLFNLYTNELYFERNAEMYLFAEPVLECELNYLDKDKIEKIFLRSGYPENDKRDTKSLYQVLADGKKVQLLKFVCKKVIQKNIYGSAPVKAYEKLELMYVYDVAKGILTDIKPDKSSISKALPVYEKAIEDFAIKKQYKLRKEEELVALVNELNQ